MFLHPLPGLAVSHQKKMCEYLNRAFVLKRKRIILQIFKNMFALDFGQDLEEE